MHRILRLFALILLLAGLTFFAAIYPVLPERIAVHYGFYGEPDGWGVKLPFVVLMCGLFAGMNVLMLVLIPLMTRYIPARMMNFPSQRMKQYWTATPERLAVVKRTVLALMAMLLVPTNLMFLNCAQMTYQTNVATPAFRVPAGPAFWTTTALLLATAAAGIIWMIASLRVPRDAAE